MKRCRCRPSGPAAERIAIQIATVFRIGEVAPWPGITPHFYSSVCHRVAQNGTVASCDRHAFAVRDRDMGGGRVLAPDRQTRPSIDRH